MKKRKVARKLRILSNRMYSLESWIRNLEAKANPTTTERGFPDPTTEPELYENEDNDLSEWDDEKGWIEVPSPDQHRRLREIEGLGQEGECVQRESTRGDIGESNELRDAGDSTAHANDNLLDPGESASVQVRGDGKKSIPC